MKVFEAIQKLDHYIITQNHRILAGYHSIYSKPTFFVVHGVSLTRDEILNMDVIEVEGWAPCLEDVLTNIKV